MRPALMTAAALLLAAPASAAAAPAASLPSQVDVLESSGTFPVPVTLSEPASEPVRVSWRTERPPIADAPLAIAGTDYVEGSGTLAFAPGESRAHLEITVIDDAVDDRGTFLGLVLHDPQGATLLQGRSTVSIADDEPTPPASVLDVTVAEDAGVALVPLARPAPSLLGLAYAWTALAGTATPGADFRPAPGPTGIPWGQMAAAIRIPIADDEEPEGDERFQVRLGPGASDPLYGRGPGPVDRALATVTITDDEPPAVARVAPLRGRVRLAGRRIERATGASRGALVDARAGQARIALARGGTATISGGAVRLGAALAQRTRRLAVRASRGVRLRVRGRVVTVASRRASWTVDGSRLTVRRGAVRAGGAQLRAGRARDLR